MLLKKKIKKKIDKYAPSNYLYVLPNWWFLKLVFESIHFESDFSTSWYPLHVFWSNINLCFFILNYYIKVETSVQTFKFKIKNIEKMSNIWPVKMFNNDRLIERILND